MHSIILQIYTMIKAVDVDLFDLFLMYILIHFCKFESLTSEKRRVLLLK